MDTRYNAKKAGKDIQPYKAGDALEHIAMEQIHNPHAMMNLSKLVKDENWTTKYDVTYCGTPAVWRILECTVETDSGSAACEAILTIQGVIAKKDLLPFEEKISPNSSHIQYLRQSLMLIGLQQPTFLRAIDNILEIHALLSRSVGHSNVEHCGMIGSFEGQPSIEMSNRYFTPKRQAGLVRDIQFTEDVDLKGYLEGAKGQVWGKKIGDIVEVQVSFILIPLKEKKFKSAMILQSLSIMDGSYTQQAIRARLQLSQARYSTQAKPAPTLKRRVGYVEEELGMTKAKLSRMEVKDREGGDFGGFGGNTLASLD
ncbi:hypothetical protein CPB84DRAFT_1753149 [Gymnopilus junonius]|uniref:Uncharacterized protein n=1 Tax=Gymnopilus junonius TaxID=109634 RepID=A0A9P5NBI0_GYMJU|nr:hypothetical protein CPB84DRAFT_1753149 [Gymnopilus junonius]